MSILIAPYFKNGLLFTPKEVKQTLEFFRHAIKRIKNETEVVSDFVDGGSNKLFGSKHEIVIYRWVDQKNYLAGRTPAYGIRFIQSPIPFLRYCSIRNYSNPMRDEIVSRQNDIHHLPKKIRRIVEKYPDSGAILLMTEKSMYDKNCESLVDYDWYFR